MGLTTAKVELRNPRRPGLTPVTIDALADTGSDYLCIPEHVRRSLALEQAGTKRVTLADGDVTRRPLCRSIAASVRHTHLFRGGGGNR